MINTLFELSITFLQIGICAFGGGLSTLPLMQYHLVDKTHWITQAQFDQIIAISQITPGPISINAATFVGYNRCGVVGSAIATISLSAAPLIALAITMFFLKHLPSRNSETFKNALKPLVAGLLTLALFPPLKSTISNGYGAIILYVIALIAIIKIPIIKNNTLLMMLIFGVLGAIFLA